MASTRPLKSRTGCGRRPLSRAARPAPRGRGSQRTRRPCVLAARAQVPPRRRTPAPRPALPIRSSGRELCARGRELYSQSPRRRVRPAAPRANRVRGRGAPREQSSRPAAPRASLAERCGGRLRGAGRQRGGADPAQIAYGPPWPIATKTTITKLSQPQHQRSGRANRRACS